jgi:hypothetical protein
MASYVKAFSIKNQWMNLSLYFINFMYKTKNKDYRNRVCSDGTFNFWIVNKYHLRGNDNPIGGIEKDNQFLAVGDKIKTCFIEIDKTDLVNFYRRPELGFAVNKEDLIGRGYARAENLDSSSSVNKTNQERLNDDINSPVYNDTGRKYYFLKGTNNNDILEYLKNSKII